MHIYYLTFSEPEIQALLSWVPQAWSFSQGCSRETYAFMSSLHWESVVFQAPLWLLQGLSFLLGVGRRHQIFLMRLLRNVSHCVTWLLSK